MKDFLLITSNLGSLFGGNHSFTDVWLNLIITTIKNENAKFVALHFQEAGGKDPDRYGDSLSSLISTIFQRLAQFKYTHCRAFLDLDAECVEEYTALASVIFIHESEADGVEQYNFKTEKYLPLTRIADGVRSHILLEDNLINCAYVRKEKFSHAFWREIRWSRKGYLHTRWKLKNSKVVDLINIHLFHDDCNITAIENSTKYRNIRGRALRHTLDSFEKWSETHGGESHLFIFGDLNVRLDVAALVESLTNGVKPLISPLDRDASLLGSELGLNRGGSESDGESSGTCASSSNSHLDSLAAVTTDKAKLSGRPIYWEYWWNGAANNCGAANSSIDKRHSRCQLRVARKIFDYCQPEELIRNFNSYRKFDIELNEYANELYEFPVKFIFTYPWSENPEESGSLMTTRPPAWCDRILMNEMAWRNCAKNDVIYDALGTDICTGDHKPVLLSFSFAK